MKKKSATIFRGVGYEVNHDTENQNVASIILYCGDNQHTINLTHDKPISLKIAEYYARKTIKTILSKSKDVRATRINTSTSSRILYKGAFGTHLKTKKRKQDLYITGANDANRIHNEKTLIRFNKILSDVKEKDFTQTNENDDSFDGLTLIQQMRRLEEGIRLAPFLK